MSKPFASSNIVGRGLLRDCAPERELFHGIAVYVIESKYKLSRGLIPLEGAITLIQEKSPAMMGNLRKVFKSVMICDRGPNFGYFYADRCLVINLLDLPKFTENQLKMHWAALMISFTWEVLLMQGRHGYIGIRYMKILKTRAEIRFVHRCINADSHLFILFLLNVMNKSIDNLRPKRRYYKRFLREDLHNFSFGKKLAVAADGNSIVEV